MCGVRLVRVVRRRRCVPVRREHDGRLSGCLGGFFSLSPSLLSPPGPLFLGLPQSSLPVGTPQLSLLQEPSTAVIRVHCGTGISQSSRSSVVLSILSLCLSAPLSRNPTSPTQRAPSGLPEPMTQLEQQGSSLALTRLLVMTAKRQCSLREPSTRSHAYSITHISGQVSAVHQLTVSFQPERLI